ncbi:MAG: hypothetical protein ACI9WU_003469 [Myxococcota bacterium]
MATVLAALNIRPAGTTSMFVSWSKRPRDPFMVKREYGGTGMETQWPMIGMFTPYWIGRMHGVITEGEGLGLAWETTDEACE